MALQVKQGGEGAGKEWWSTIGTLAHRSDRDERSLRACNSLSRLLCLFSLALTRSAARRCSLQFRLSLSLTLSASRRCSLQFRRLSLSLSRSLSRSSWLALCLLFLALWRSLSLCSSVKLCRLALCRSLSRCSSLNPSLLHVVFILLSFVDITEKGFSISFCYDKLWLTRSHEERNFSFKRWSCDFPPSKTRVAQTRNFPPKESVVSSCDIWHRLTWSVCTGGRTLRHNQIFSDG